jgi:hypothetical protein
MSESPVQLEEFVSNAVTQIMRALAKAGPEVRALKGELNPRPYGGGSELAQAGVTRAVGGGALSYIDFDIAVTATKGSGRESGVGVVFAAIGAGVKEKNASDRQTVSRISFRLPVRFPPGQE